MNTHTEAALTKIDDWFSAYGEAVVSTAQDLIRIPSVNPKFDASASPGGEANVQDYLADRLADLDIESHQYEALPGRPNLYTDFADSNGRSLVFNGHIDVVPVGDLKTWTRDPFGAELADGRVYGRGAVDMKGGIACSLVALQALRETRFPNLGAIGFHAVVDEEAGGAGTRNLLRKVTAPTAAIVAEPSNEELQTAQGGLEWVRVTLRGQSGHTGWRYADLYPQREGDPLEEMNVNAIDLVADLAREIRRLEWKWAMSRRHPLLPPGGTTISPGALRAGSGLDDNGLPVHFDNPAVVPDTAVIDFDVKFFPGEEDSVREEFERCVLNWAQQHPWLLEHPPTFQWELQGLWFPSMNTSETDPIVESVSRNLRRLGETPRIAGFPAVADAGFYSHAGSSALIFGPDGAGLHGADEWVGVDSMRRVAQVMAMTAIEYLGMD